MKRLTPLVIACFFVSILSTVASIFVEAHYRGRAQLIQRVRRDAATDLFGDSGTPVGSPQPMIITDPKAFTGKRSPEGAAEVDESYLERNGIYPLQLKTVSYLANLVRIAALGVALLMAVSWALLRRNASRSDSPAS